MFRPRESGHPGQTLEGYESVRIGEIDRDHPAGNPDLQEELFRLAGVIRAW